MSGGANTALALARLRARRSVDAGALDAATVAAASACGRAVVRAGDRAVLGWADGRSPSGSETVVLRRLTRARAALLAVVLAHCWPDPDSAPWPGEPASRADVLASAGRLGVDLKHAVGTLDAEFVAWGLVDADGETLRLGPAVAAWTATEVAALRRLHPRLAAARR